MVPRMAIAAPTFEGGRPRPPLKKKGREVGGSVERGVERKMNQREPKVPTVSERRKREIRVVRTLRVHIRRMGRTLGVLGGGIFRGVFFGGGTAPCSVSLGPPKEGVSGTAAERAEYWCVLRRKTRRKEEAMARRRRMP